MSGEVMMPCGRSDLPESADMHCAGCGFRAGEHPQWAGGRSAPRRPEYPMGGSYGPIDPDNPQWDYTPWPQPTLPAGFAEAFLSLLAEDALFRAEVRRLLLLDKRPGLA